MMSSRGRSIAVLIAALVMATQAVPIAAADRDSDGLSDAFEQRYGLTDPNDRDSDHDGVIDSAEDNDGDGLGNLGEQRFGTHPGRRDTDRDGRWDGREDADRDGRSNAREQDRRRVPARLKPTIAAAKRSYPGIRKACLAVRGRARPVVCEFGPIGGTRVALIGDSHAMMWSSPVRRVARNKGWRVLTMTKTACPALLGIYVLSQKIVDRGASCREWQRRVIDKLQADPPDLIIIAQSDRYSLHRPSGVKHPKSQRPRLWKQALQRTLNVLPRSSQVLVVGGVPRNSSNPRKCLRSNRRDISACVTPRVGPGGRKIESVLRATARANGVAFLSPYRRICSYDPCPLVQGNILMWRDKSHLTDAFARQLQPTWRRAMEVALR